MASIDLYRTFIKTVELGSMVKASEELYISQPAVTKAIKKIEEDLGGPLFIRNKNKLELTAEGRMLYEKMKAAFEIIDNAKAEFNQYHELKKGEVRIGISTMLTKILLMDKVMEFKNKYSGINVIIENGVTANSVSMMQRGQLDLCVLNKEALNMSANTVNLDVKKITELKYCFIYNPEFFTFTDIKDFLDYPFIIQKERSSARESINDFFNKAGKQPNITAEAVSNEIIIEMVARGLGIGCVYEKLADMNNNIKKLPLEDAISTDIYVVTHNKSMLTPAAKAFVETLNDF